MEKRHNYVGKVAEVAIQMFITNDKVNVTGLVLAGSADFKTELSLSDMFDPVSTISRYISKLSLRQIIWYNFCINKNDLFKVLIFFLEVVCGIVTLHWCQVLICDSGISRS